jgi:hypothetical protein
MRDAGYLWTREGLVGHLSGGCDGENSEKSGGKNSGMHHAPRIV